MHFLVRLFQSTKELFIRAINALLLMEVSAKKDFNAVNIHE